MSLLLGLGIGAFGAIGFYSMAFVIESDLAESFFQKSVQCVRETFFADEYVQFVLQELHSGRKLSLNMLLYSSIIVYRHRLQTDELCMEPDELCTYLFACNWNGISIESADFFTDLKDFVLGSQFLREYTVSQVLGHKSHKVAVKLAPFWDKVVKDMFLESPLVRQDIKELLYNQHE